MRESVNDLQHIVRRLRAMASDALYWGADRHLLPSWEEVRGLTARLQARTDSLGAEAIERHYRADINLQAPRAGLEVAVDCADGETVSRRWRLDYGENIVHRLRDVEYEVQAESPARMIGLSDTDRAGHGGPQTTLWIHRLTSPCDSFTVEQRVRNSTEDLAGAALPVHDVLDAAPRPKSLRVTEEEARILGEIGSVVASMVPRAENFWGHEKLESLADDLRSIEVADVDRAGAVWTPRPTVGTGIGAECAIFNAAGEMLLVLRLDTSTWCIPGGATEIGELPAEAALREAKEETGIDADLLGPVRLFSGRHGSHVRIGAISTYLATVRDPEQAARPQPQEALEVRWVSREESRDLEYFHAHSEKVPWAFATYERSGR
ncbi:NUDIX domain-containing protein [Salininema proteolyticum]|uniref:NUDIX domain-containing protein n=1 Tax=Salininema proteolyticum TaxID=1607685 RepID=A0ABV8U0T2_9ACTN